MSVPTGARTDSGELDAHLRAALDAARAAAEIITASFGDPANVRSKAPGDWVSDTDTASERAVRAVLERAAPDVAVFGEEEGGDRGPLGWIVDPLDGTSNFLHRFPIVGVSIALVADGRPVVAVVDAPLLETTFTAVAGGGAYCDGRRISVSDRAPESAICATGFPFRHPKLLPRYLDAFHGAIECFEDLRRAGAASLDLAWTAAGVFDGYFELALGPWDVAAGALLVREAGGLVTDWAGDDRAWLDSGNIVVGNPVVHSRILEIVRPARS